MGRGFEISRFLHFLGLKKDWNMAIFHFLSFQNTEQFNKF